jgi:hypothetical protein
MTLNHPTRLAQALVLAAIVTVLGLPAIALGGVNSSYGPHDGWYTYATSVTNVHNSAVRDSNPYGPRDGWYTYAASVTRSATASPADGRSPDTRDAADAAQLQVVDGRSPDTLDAAQAVQPIELVSSSGFDWSDAGIGAGLGAAAITLLGASLLFVFTHRRDRVQAT